MPAGTYFISADTTLIYRTPGTADVQVDYLGQAYTPVSAPHVRPDGLYLLAQDDYQNEISLLRFPLPLRPEAPPEICWRCGPRDGLCGILDTLWFDGGVLMVAEICAPDGAPIAGNGFQARGLDGTLLWEIRGADLPDTAWLDRVCRDTDGSLVALCTHTGSQVSALRAAAADLRQPPGPWIHDPALDALLSLVPNDGVQLVMVDSDHALVAGHRSVDEQGRSTVALVNRAATPLSITRTWEVDGVIGHLGARDGELWLEQIRDEDRTLLTLTDGGLEVCYAGVGWPTLSRS